ncbi:TetR/AcrR family transcriptional regulator [Williamsia sp. R60]
MTAALEEYALTGWGSFTMQGVARRAGVGKSALYLRWPTREQLLMDSIEAVTIPLTAGFDSGALRSDLGGTAQELMRYLLDPIGWSTLRIAVDVAVEFAELDQFQERIVDTVGDAVSRVFSRAVDRGEIDSTADIEALVQTLFGSILVHVLGLSPKARRAAQDRIAPHVEPLVDVVYRAATSAR